MRLTCGREGNRPAVTDTGVDRSGWREEAESHGGGQSEVMELDYRGREDNIAHPPLCDTHPSPSHSQIVCASLASSLWHKGL